MLRLVPVTVRCGAAVVVVAREAVVQVVLVAAAVAAVLVVVAVVAVMAVVQVVLAVVRVAVAAVAAEAVTRVRVRYSTRGVVGAVQGRVHGLAG